MFCGGVAKQVLNWEYPTAKLIKIIKRQFFCFIIFLKTKNHVYLFIVFVNILIYIIDVCLYFLKNLEFECDKKQTKKMKRQFFA